MSKRDELRKSWGESLRKPAHERNLPHVLWLIPGSREMRVFVPGLTESNFDAKTGPGGTILPVSSLEFGHPHSAGYGKIAKVFWQTGIVCVYMPATTKTIETEREAELAKSKAAFEARMKEGKEILSKQKTVETERRKKVAEAIKNKSALG